VGAVLPAVPLALPGRLIDVGSGSGSPGLVFALMRDDLEVTLLEPRKRRWSFLREAARAAGRPVRVLQERHDSHNGPPARTVTLRALALTLADVAPLVEPDGRVVWFGERPRHDGPFEEDIGRGAKGQGFHVYRRSPDVPRET
jgi:16S rRNA G527 N7-methylase RsmG